MCNQTIYKELTRKISRLTWFVIIFSVLFFQVFFQKNIVYAENEQNNTQSDLSGNATPLSDTIINTDITLTSDVTYENVYLKNGIVNLNGYKMNVNGKLIQSKGTLKINGGRANISGDYRIQTETKNQDGTYSYSGSYGYLNMTNENDYVQVSGTFVTQAYSSHANYLTAGALEVKGDFIQTLYGYSNNFAASGTHKVILSGTGVQSINFENPGSSYFNILEIKNNEGQKIYYNTDLNFKQINTNSTITSETGNIFIKTYSIDMSGCTLNITGNLIQSNGTLKINGGRINITGDYRIQTMKKNQDGSYSYGGSNGILNMTNENDYIQVGGTFVTQAYSSHVNYLTAGALEVKGDFIQTLYGYSYNFAASGTHKVILSGTGVQSINFETPGQSYFNILEIKNTDGQKIHYNTALNFNKIITNGTFKSDVPLIIGGRDIALTDNIEVIGDLYINTNTLDLSGYTFSLTGKVIQSGGTLKINGGRLNISGDYRIQTMTKNQDGTYAYGGSNGYLNMTNENDYIQVGGTFVTQAYPSHASYLTAGALEVKGDFIQKLYGYSYNFAASETHKVILSGTGVQSINFETPGQSYFNILKIKNIEGQNIHYNTDLNFKQINTNATITSETGNIFIKSYSLDMSGCTLNITGNLIQPGGTLKINGGRLNISGDYRIQTMTKNQDGTYAYGGSNGYLNMTNENDYIQVGGTFVTQAYPSHANYLTAGVLEVKGNFIQKLYGYAYNFAPSGTHKVILSGTTTQNINFQNYTQSHFNILYISLPLDVGYTFNHRPVWHWVYYMGPYESSEYYLNSNERFRNATTVCSKDPVDLATGNFFTSKTDISVGGFMPIGFSRTYNIQGSYLGTLGTNWKGNYEYKLTKSDTKVSITFGDGHVQDFLLNMDGTYSSMLGEYENLQIIDASTYKLITKNKTVYYFDAKGNLSRIDDINGNKILYSYDNGKLVKVSNDCGFLTFVYTGDKISKITDNSGRSIEYKYTGDNLTGFKNLEGAVYTYEYDNKNRLIKMIDPLNNVTISNTFDDKDRTTYQIMADGVTNGIVYDDDKMTTVLTEGNGAQVFYKRDDKFRIYEKVYIDGTEKTTFDQNNQVKEFTDKNGNIYKYEHDNNGNTTKEIDALGNIKEFTYNESNKVTSATNPDGTIFTYSYDNKGNLTSMKDPLLRETKMEYNTKGLPVKVFLPNGSFSEMIYDIAGNVISVKDPEGNITTMEYDLLNKVSKIVKPLGNIVTFEYTPTGKTKKITNPDGTYITTVYDARGLIIEEKDESLRSTKYKYNSMGKLVEKTDPAGGITKYEYDLMWNVIKVTMPDASEIKSKYDISNKLVSTTDAQGKTKRFSHDANGNIIKSTDAKNNETSFSYDQLNRLVQAVLPNKATSKFEYRYDDKILKLIDAMNNMTEYMYNDSGDLIWVKDPLGNVISYTYNSNGNIETIKDAKGAITKYLYNNNGKTTKVENADGTAIAMIYDKNGNLSQVTDENGYNESYEYDLCDRLVTSIDKNGKKKLIKYNPTGSVSEVIDEMGNSTKYTYDVLDRLIQVIDAKGSKVLYKYDAVGNLIEVHKFGGSYSDSAIITKYNYDRMGRLLKEISPDSKIIVYKYDENGNLISKTDKDSTVTKFEYDAVNNLKKTIYSNAKTVEYSYNLLNQVTGMKDWLGENTYNLDALGRVTKVKDYKNRITSYTWSSTGEKVSITYPDSTQIKNEYDVMGRLVKVVDNQNEPINIYKYGKAGELLEKTYGISNKTKYSYDKLKRITRIENVSSSSNPKDIYSYHYDSVGNKIAINKNGIETKYSYDELGRLLEVKNADNTSKKYSYDRLGNRIKEETFDNKMLKNTINYKYDNLDKLILMKSVGADLKNTDLNLKNGIQLQYDARGNLTNQTSLNKVLGQYTFDPSNKLVQSVNSNGEKSTFTYDGYGKRVAYHFEENKGLTKKAYQYLNDITMPNNSLIGMEITSGDKLIETQNFAYGLGLISMNKKNISTSTNERLYYFNDEMGSPVKIFDKNGVAIETLAYDEFGRPLAGDVKVGIPSTSNVFSYTGYQLDKSTGLMYAQARYYMPAVGRFVSEDSVKGKATETQTLNRYVYCLGNPLMFVDPSGHDAKYLWLDDIWNWAFGKNASVALDTAITAGTCQDELNSVTLVTGAVTFAKGLAAFSLPKAELYQAYIETGNTHKWTQAQLQCSVDIRGYFRKFHGKNCINPGFIIDTDPNSNLVQFIVPAKP